MVTRALLNCTIFADVAQWARREVESHAQETSLGRGKMRKFSERQGLRVLGIEKLRTKQWRCSEIALDTTKISGRTG